jgi:hypothetical protein
MCIECGCEALGSETGIIPVTIIDASTDGESGLTLDMTSTPAQTESFIEEVPLHEMGEGTVDPD